MRRGYAFVILFALFIAVSQPLKNRYFVRKDIVDPTVTKLLLQMGILFVLFIVPGLLLARWYYKMKDKDANRRY